MRELFTPVELINLPWIDTLQSTLFRVSVLLCSVLLRECLVVTDGAPPRALVEVIDPRDPASLDATERKFDLRWIRHAAVMNQYQRLDDLANDIIAALEHVRRIASKESEVADCVSLYPKNPLCHTRALVIFRPMLLRSTCSECFYPSSRKLSHILTLPAL
jgi:hypothetical protein